MPKNLVCPIVYNMNTQKLKFVACMPEQTGISTMHFPEVSGGTYGPPETLEKCIVEVPIIWLLDPGLSFVCSLLLHRLPILLLCVK